jgi:tetratricopeptide (TPR) repeat protein
MTRMNSLKEPDQNSTGNQQLTPPGASDPQADGGRGNRLLLSVAAGFLVLLGGLSSVLFFLPARQDAGQPPPQQIQARPAPAETEAADPLVEASRAAAVAARERFLTLQIGAESENIGQWGGAEYQDVEEMFGEADRMFQNSGFSEAADLYLQTIAALETLIETRGQRLGAAVLEGQRLLADVKPAEAEARFRLALLIEPSSEEARAGLKRAEAIAAVQTHFQNALALEADNNLAGAAALLRKALDIDAGYERARERLQNIETRINESQFTSEMNGLLAALDRQDFALAGRSLERLKKLGIRSAQVDQAEALLAEKQQLAEVERLRTEAAAFEGREQWQQALERYERILLMAPDALFSVAGRDRAVRRAQLDRALVSAIDQPQRLQDHEQRSAARRLLTYAGQAEPRGPHLDSQIERLSALVKAAETPVSVTLESDNQTSVVIYHVGSFGAFFSHRLSLQPGTYTVVGSRPGYRDVRKEMTIAADGGTYRLDIRCEEPI